MHRAALLLGVLFAQWSWADDLAPANGASARILSCGPAPRVALEVFTWSEADGRVTLRRETGAADGELPGPRPKGRGKPVPGCPHGLPLPSAAWNVVPAGTWTRDGNGAWKDEKGRPAKVSCVAATVKAVENATVLAPNPKGDGCGGENQLVLVGGPRVATPVVKCKLVSGQRTWTLAFGVELVASDDDCGGGFDWRVTTSSQRE